MNLYYSDTSALASAYFEDETDTDDLRLLLLEGDEPVVTSELTRIEMASAICAAGRAKRVNPTRLLNKLDQHLAPGGPITPLAFTPGSVLAKGIEIIQSQHLRTLDALHLAVALTDALNLALAANAQLVFVTRDRKQATAARALGLEVA